MTLAEIFIIAAGIVSLCWIFTMRWIADVRDEASVVKHRVDKHHEALDLQLLYNRAVEDHLLRLDRATGSTRPTCAETGCETTVGIQGARCSRCIRALRVKDS